MSNLKFADTHNLVAFLSKPAESKGFEQIVDFLNAQPIRHALTVNPTIYTSCIEQFWATVKVKTVNGEVQLHALVDGKKIIINESTVRRDLQLEDAEGIDCLPNSTIFEQLALMGYEKISQKLTFYKPFFSPQWKFMIHTILQCLSAKTTAWNEFSSTMASAIICLATNQKFNFSKYIFESMVKNLDNVSGNFLMYPRFVQVFVNQQLDGLPSHKRIYDAPSHTKKIFRNIRRVGKGLSGRETPLFQTMVVQDQAKMGKGSVMPTDPHQTPTIIQPSPQPQKKQKPRKPKRKDTQIPHSSGPTEHVADEAVYKERGDSLVRAATTASSLEAEQDSGNIDKTQSKATLNEPSSPETSSGSGPKHQETMRDTIAQTRFENVSKISNDPLLARVLDLEKTKTTQAEEIVSLKRRVKKLEQKKDKGKGILVEEPVKPKKKDLIRLDEEITSKLQDEFDEEERLAREKDEASLAQRLQAQEQEELTDEEKERLFVQFLEQRRKHFAAKKAEEKRNKPPTQAQQRRIMCTYLKNMEGKKPIDLKNKSFDSIQKMFDRAFKRVNTFVDFRTDLVEGSSKRAGDELEREVTKKQKVDDVQETAKVDNDQEAAKIKELMKIVPDKEEVAIDAIPLAIKPPSIVDWKIHKEGKKNYYQIIRADESSKMYLVFSHMLKRFDREDLQTLWKLVKAKHGSTRPEEGYEREL
ncbi:hypothetical protein Tco_0693429 [Tanacetum coccineum]